MQTDEKSGDGKRAGSNDGLKPHVEGIVGRDDDNGCQATPHYKLMAQLMDSRVAKSEREWAAVRRIEVLCDWIRQEGMQTDTCTFNVLGEICEGCRCKRRRFKHE